SESDAGAHGDPGLTGRREGSRTRPDRCEAGARAGSRCAARAGPGAAPPANAQETADPEAQAETGCGSSSEADDARAGRRDAAAGAGRRDAATRAGTHRSTFRTRTTARADHHAGGRACPRREGRTDRCDGAARGRGRPRAAARAHVGRAGVGFGSARPPGGTGRRARVHRCPERSPREARANRPGIDGLEATRRILGADGPPVVLLLSTYEEEEYAPRAAECGAASYIPKAVFGPDRLEAAWTEASGS